MGSAVQEFGEQQAKALIPRVAEDANKYSRGMLAVVGGCEEYPAAPVMAAQAAARAGAGYVKLFAPEGAARAARTHLLSIPVASCTATACGSFDPECASQLLDGAAKAQALVVGCGLGTSSFAGEFLTRLFEGLASRHDARPMLIDADALNVLAAHPGLSALRAGCDDVATPHEGEAARLLGRPIAEREIDARELAQRLECTVVLKGPRTLVTAPDGALAACSEPGRELSKAGTGDVLAGVIGSFMAQGLSAFDAARLGVFVHGRAGKLAASSFSVNAVMAEDIIDAIGPAFISLGV